MRSLFLLVILFFSLISKGQIHNRLIKFNVGFTNEQIDHKGIIEDYNDTTVGPGTFEFVSKAPSFSYTHQYVISDIISFSGKAGFQYLNIFFNNQHYGSPFVYFSINPELSIIYRKRFEYYIKLQAGLSYWFNRPDLLNGPIERVFPTGVTPFTGVTIGGFNYYISDKLGLNLELSLWSPEVLTFGLSYRFFKGELPTLQELKELQEL